ncbi:MAG: hypothetical protein EPN21_03975 [Methylococcaceae bacterium]|nr:MAG: hypothetical protein EPN21_03975 [Methylococcaceae bacterium]
MKPIALATEDALSEEIGKRLVAETGSRLQVHQTFRKQGFGYLKSNLQRFREVSRQMPLILLTDLDRATCAPSLINDLLPKPGSTSPIGLGYNAVLGDFIRTQWNGERAVHHSPSLAQARVRIKALADSVCAQDRR